MTAVYGWQHSTCGFIKSYHDIELSYVPWYCPRCQAGEKGQWVRQLLYTTDREEER